MLVVNADDPLVADLADGRHNALRFGVDDPRLARPALQHAADSKYCVRCGEPYDYAAAYVGPPRRLPLPQLRPRAPAARHRGPLDRPAGARRLRLRPRDACRNRAGAAATPRPLQRLQRPCRRGRRPGTRCIARRDRDRARDLHGRVRAVRANRGRRPRHPDAADQEPGRRERGDPNARGGRRARHPRDRAQRPDRRRPRRLVDLGRRLRAAPRPRRAHRRKRRAGRRARAPVHLRRLPAVAARGDSRPHARRSIAGSRSSRRAASSACSRPTPRCSSFAPIAVARGLARPFWEETA